MTDLNEASASPPLDSSNRFLVGLKLDNTVAIMNPPFRGAMTKDEALNLAAWLVAIADPSGARFEPTLRAIRNT